MMRCLYCKKRLEEGMGRNVPCILYTYVTDFASNSAMDTLCMRCFDAVEHALNVALDEVIHRLRMEAVVDLLLAGDQSSGD